VRLAFAQVKARFRSPGRCGQNEPTTVVPGSFDGTVSSNVPTFQLMRRTAGLPSSTVAQERAVARPGRRSLAVAISLLACLVAPVALTSAASAQSIDDKRAQVEAIADEIEANGMEISRLDEELLEAQLRIGELESRMADTEASISSARAAARDAGSDLEVRAAELYVSGSSSAGLPSFDADDFSDAGAREIYLEVAAKHDSEMIDDLRAANARLGDQLDDLSAAKAQADAERARLDAARTDLEAANARQQELLAQTEGELADLIAAERERREREEAERARRAAEARDNADDGNGSNDNDGDDSSGDNGGGDNGGGDNGGGDNGGGDNGGGDNGGGGGPDVVAPNPRAQTAVDAALDQLGTPYSFATPGSWDNPDPDSFDCSGLTGWAWYQAGYSLPHSSRAQFASLPHVAQSDLLPGDLVFYGSPIHHVGMYIGDGQYVHAPQTGDVVKISSIYRDDWAGGARVPG
jgi:peptidoglycan DL-endopeptidase CwlO